MAVAPAIGFQDVAPTRRATFMHALAFVGGFSVIFIILGASLGIAGSALQDNIIWFQRVAGVALIVLGLHLSELITIPFLMRTMQFGDDLPRTNVTTKPRGRFRKYGRSVFVGGSFSVGWTPCVGPILAGILTLSADSASVGQGTLLLVFYAAGLGIPFLIAGAALGSSTALLRKMGPYMRYISIVAGVMLIFVGMLIFLDRVTVLNDNFSFLPGAAEDATATGGSVTGTFGFTVAFLGGILSFLSPCVLPLVPIYLSHLAGESANELAIARDEAGVIVPTDLDGPPPASAPATTGASSGGGGGD
jgi:cytochrome c-type biogenesis protein